MYALATLRLNALERRAPVAGATLSGFLGAAAVLPTDARVAFLVGLPIALLWYLRTTVIHSWSFEDALRRIEELEHLINRVAGEPLLGFQSSHPSRGLSVGGRTGRETLVSVAGTCALLLAGCIALLATTDGLPGAAVAIYFGYATVACLAGARVLLRGRRYRYRKRHQPQG